MSQNLMELNWTEIEALDKDKTVVMIGMAPIEEHGRHLPIGVDVYETEYWMSLSVDKLERAFPQNLFLTMPVITFGHAELRGFVGNIHFSQKLIYDIVVEMLEAIASWGIKNIVIISGHADPKHLIAIEQGCERINKKYGKIAFSPMGAIFSRDIIEKKNIKNEEMYAKIKEFPNDFHAGWIETSNMLSIYPDKVNENFKELPDVSIKPDEMIFPEIIEEKTKGQGHIGYPKEASKKLGDVLNEDAAEKIKMCVEAFLLKHHYEQYEHHELYEIPFLKVKI